ncbi:hypothetical protein J4459_03975 [Candidatus Woesearchaeota archaeon]|nr:hypothetical protein [Candidatus Woesearchaeota archaeon]
MFTKEEEKDIYNYWYNNLKGFKFTHTTSSIIAEEILKKGLDPRKRLDIFKDAIILNGLLRKYALFRTDSLDPYVLERNYFFVSPMKVYVHYKIPEVLMHLLDFAIPSIKKLEIVLPTNGNFDLFEKTMKESGIKIYTTKDNYESINFDEFRRDLNEIKVLTIQIKQFEENSTSVTLFINNEAILNLLPETLRRILTDFEYFKSTIFLWPNDKPKDVHKYVEDILRNNEIIVTKKINKKYITMAISEQ